jgi:hypothetical protein
MGEYIAKGWTVAEFEKELTIVAFALSDMV